MHNCIEQSSITTEAFDLVVSIAGAEIGEGALLAEVLGIEGATELDESAFSFDGMTVSLERTADGKVKAIVVPEGSPAAFFLRVRIEEVREVLQMWKCCKWPIPITNWPLATLKLVTFPQWQHSPV